VHIADHLPREFDGPMLRPGLRDEGVIEPLGTGRSARWRRR
jgi:hypothetical protein